MKCLVYLVGAGPGDPSLITVRGLECLRRAEVVIYDNLCNPSLLRETPRNAEIIYAGKHAGRPTLTQEKIEKIMVQRAHAGKIVVRLKGGDPFVFGRGAEEAETLQKNKIKYEVVPGITSAIAAPAYAGIPATHRDHASAVAVATAYEDPDKPGALLDFQAMARFPGTLVLLMGVRRLEEVTTKLMANGKNPSTPAALVRWGTRGFQQTLTGRLGNISEKVVRLDFRPPAVAVIGDVVRCRKKIRWFESKPLFGRRMVVTRSREQSGELAHRLRDLGAEVLELPTIEIQKIENARVRWAAQRAGEWDWVIFTSPLAVDFFLETVLREHEDLRILKNARFAVVGDATEDRLKKWGLKARLKPKIHTAEGLAAEIRSSRLGFWNCRILLPRSEIAKKEMETAVREAGGRPYPLPIYRNRPPRLNWELEALKRMIEQWNPLPQTPLTIFFTSSSTAENFSKLLPQLPENIRKEIKKSRFISIGSSTSATLRKFRMKVFAEAKKPSLEGLIKAARSKI